MMKKILNLSVLALIGVAFLSACTAAKPEQTIENLKAAVDGEASASAKYAAFSQKAQEEGLLNIAVLFEATSAAEAIHRDNHLAELKKLGVEYTPVVEDFAVDTTLANLYTAKAGEEHEVDIMYAEFIKVAEAEKANGALISFDWAIKAEEKHAGFYNDAIRMLEEQGNDSTLIVSWAICEKCGDTYKLDELGKACLLCGNPAEKFMIFENKVQ